MRLNGIVDRLLLVSAVLLGALFLHPHFAHAIPPPDVIASFGSQLSQLIGFGIMLFSISIGIVVSVFQRIALRVGIRPKIFLKFVVFSLAFVISGLYIFVSYKTALYQRAYTQQIAEDLKRGFDTAELAEDSVVPEDFIVPADLPLLISNDAFRVLESLKPFILDAREDEEYGYGRYPGSTHIRFADLMNGEWAKIPTNQPVYVFCWSGIRGEMVATFLRTKGIRAQYIENGSDGWVRDGGVWEGKVSFAVEYPEERYSKLITTAEAHAAVSSGVLLVDTRDSVTFAKSHIAGSINISAIFTPSNTLADEVAAVPIRATVITVCDSFVSCFDAKIVALKLEASGHTFLGRYNTPWDY